jgi:hypothetical protein
MLKRVSVVKYGTAFANVRGGWGDIQARAATSLALVNDVDGKAAVVPDQSDL